jgi:hypothetical protein
MKLEIFAEPHFVRLCRWLGSEASMTPAPSLIDALLVQAAIGVAQTPLEFATTPITREEFLRRAGEAWDLTQEAITVTKAGAS